MDKELDGSETKEELMEEATEIEKDVTNDDEQGEDDNDEEDDEDDDDDDDEEDEEWESDEDVLGEDNEGEEDDDDDEEDDEVEAVLEASDSDGEDVERCPICLNRFKDQDVGTPECCDHVFCLECVHEWSTNVNTCPVDRQVFKLILCRHGVDDIIYKKISVADVNKQKEEEEEEEEPTYCEVCHECDREDRLLLCDGCDLGYHLECLTPPLSEVPVEEWFCPNCARRAGEDAEYLPHTASGYRRQIPRTLVMERVRSAIEERRVRRTRTLQELATSDEEEGMGSEEELETNKTDTKAAASSSSPVKKSPVKKRTTKRKTPRKYRRRKRKSTKSKTTKKRTSSSTTPKKRKTRKRRKVKRKGKKGKKTKRLARTVKPAATTSVKTRIAGALGIINPPPGRTIPIQKTKQEKTLDVQRTDIGASSLSIFGHKDQINFYEDEQDEPGTSVDTSSGSGATRKYSRLALSSYKPIGRVPTILPVKKKKKIVINTTPGACGGDALDLLGSIMQGQDKLHLSSKKLTIQRDGSLTEKPGNTPLKTSSKTSDTSSNSGSTLFKSSFTAVDRSSNTQSSVLSSLKSESSEKKAEEDEEYDPAFPTDEVDDDIENGNEDKDKKESEDEYDPAHPTDDVSSDEDNANGSVNESDSQVKVSEENIAEKMKKTVEETNKALRKEASPGKISSLTEKSPSKSEEVSKVKDFAIFSEVEQDKTSVKSKDNEKNHEIAMPKQEKTPDKSSSIEKKESPIKKSPSIKITESSKKSSVKPFEISRKTLFEKRRLYGGEIDFSEDVDFSEGAFPETFELSVKRIEEVFKGTKNKSESKTIETESEKLVKESSDKGEKDKTKSDIDIKETSEVENVIKSSKENKSVSDEKSKVDKETKEKIKFTGKFKPISSNSDENIGTTKISVSDRFKKISTDRNSPEIANLEEEDPIHEMRKLDKELDLEFGNADYSKKKEKDKESRKSKRKVSLDENDSDIVRHRRESKENREKRKTETDYKYVYEEKEEGEVDDDIRLKEKKKRDKKKRKTEKDRDKYYEEKGESDLDRRIVIQVSQNTDDRTVWEEEERQRKKRDREERRRDKERLKDSEKDSKREKKHKRLRSRSRSHERRNRSRSRDKRRSKSRSRDRDRSRDRSRRKRRDRSRSRSRDWSHDRSRKKKKKDRNRSRDRERELSRELSREREWSKERDWSSERGRGRSRGHSRDRKRSREHSEDRVDIFGRSRSPFTRREFLKDKQNLAHRKKPKQDIEDDDVIVLDSPPPAKKPTYDEVSSSESEKDAQTVTKNIETISRIEVKDNSAREAPASFVEADDKDDEFDSEPEETEQFQYTDRDEFLGQNKSKQMRQNLITIGVSGNDYDPANPTCTSSPVPPPLPEPISAPTPPLPPSGDFTQFPPPPPGPPPQGPPPGSVILQERPPMHVQGSAPPGPGILGEGPIILQGPPPPIEAGPPGIIQQRPAMSVPVNINVLPPGFHRGLPPTITSQRQLIVSPLRPGAPRLQRLASPGGVRFGWQVTTNSEVIPSQFGSRIPSPAGLPGHPLINGPFDGLPPPQSEALPPHSLPPGHPQFPPPAVTPGEPPHVLAIKTDTPPPNIVQIPVEMNDASRHLPPGSETQLIHLGPDPRAPPPRLPIPLLPSASEPPPMSVMVSIPPPVSSLMSMPPPGTALSDPFQRSGTPPNSVSAILGLARIGTLPTVSSAMIPELSSSAAMVNGDSLNHGNKLKTEGTLNELEKISELLNTQAHLMVMSKEGQNSSDKAGNNSVKSGVAIKMEDVFKVPQVPVGKSGAKNEVDATEVVDMDMGSPINEEGNIELPVSPQFDNLIDNPEDLLEEDFNKKMQKLHEKVEKEVVNPKDKTLTPTKNKDVKDLDKKDSPFKSKEEKRKRSSKENKHDKSGHKSRKHKPKPEKDLKEKALKDAHIDLDSQDVPSSAVDMTIKEKYLKKLHLQERVVEEVKMAIKPFYSGKKINKDQYKDILRKAVPKICHSKSGNINPMKIKNLVEAYVEKYTKSNHSKGETFPSPEVNGDSAKTKVTR